MRDSGVRVPMAEYRRLLATYLRPQWRRSVLVGGLLLGSIGLQLAGPQVLRAFVDQATAGAALAQLVQLALLFIGLALVQQALSVAATYHAETLGWTATNELRADLASHCLRL